jgi:hypothetical protein
VRGMFGSKGYGKIEAWETLYVEELSSSYI